MQHGPPISFIQLRPGCLLLYAIPFSTYCGIVFPREESLFPKKANEKYTGLMNAKAASKLRFAINLLLAISEWKEVFNEKTKRFYKFKINFVTLTLSAPQLHVTDKEIKSKMLDPFIRNMKNIHKMTSYVWRAEVQKNGNLHFHITTNVYIPYDAICKAWNLQQAKFHFIEMFRHKNKSEFPNSTDVHSVYNIKDLASYLVKYMSKNHKGDRALDGKVWDCSQNLKPKKKCAIEIESSDYNWLSDLYNYNPDSFVQHDNCTIVQLRDKKQFGFIPNSYQAQYSTWLQSVKNCTINTVV